MQLSSPAFQNGGSIPSLYTCEGKNIHPPLEISNVPKNAVTLVLIIEDPDVPTWVREDKMWNHWIIFNIPPDTLNISETGKPPGIEGMSTGGTLGYEGPCPPDREHRYFFKLYALDKCLLLKEGASKSEVEKAIKGHILKETSYMGRYQKKQK